MNSDLIERNLMDRDLMDRALTENNGRERIVLTPPALPLPLTTDEVEVLLCFALASPLHYGPIEEKLCDKLQSHLRRLYCGRKGECLLERVS